MQRCIQLCGRGLGDEINVPEISIMSAELDEDMVASDKMHAVFTLMADNNLTVEATEYKYIRTRIFWTPRARQNLKICKDRIVLEP